MIDPRLVKVPGRTQNVSNGGDAGANLESMNVLGSNL